MARRRHTHKSKNPDADRILAGARAQAGIDRAEYFSRPGATVAGWRGGAHTVQKDRRKDASRKACRKGNW